MYVVWQCWHTDFSHAIVFLILLASWFIVSLPIRTDLSYKRFTNHRPIVRNIIKCHNCPYPAISWWTLSGRWFRLGDITQFKLSCHRSHVPIGAKKIWLPFFSDNQDTRSIIHDANDINKCLYLYPILIELTLKLKQNCDHFVFWLNSHWGRNGNGHFCTCHF